jgi:peptidoglycan/xylan/chitin deacetylase (PgdA/CDA1 family)
MKSLLATSLGWRMLAPMLRPSGITLLMYHSVYEGRTVFDGMHVDRFRQQMEWLAHNCEIVDPNNFEDALAHSSRLKPSVMLTFDDGYRDYHDVAYPILHRLRLPSLVFLTTGFMDGPGLIWTEIVSWAVRTTTRTSAALPWDASRRFDLSDAAQRRGFERACKHHLKAIPSEESDHWQGVLMQTLGVDPQSLLAERRMLNWDEVRAASEFTRYGGHTHTHPILSQVSPERARHEIVLCRDRIATETGIAPTHFAYPNGREQDFTEVTSRILIETGFHLGHSSIGGVHRLGMDPMAIRRQPTGTSRLGDFALLVAGVTESR